MYDLSLAIGAVTRPLPAAMFSEVPLATEADFGRDAGLNPFASLQPEEVDSLVYYNAATCPDCGGSMLRQGRCGVCPSCGFESCLV